MSKPIEIGEAVKEEILKRKIATLVREAKSRYLRIGP